MTNNLPAKSTSRGIQRAHRRKYSSGKVTVVNKNNKKKKKKSRSFVETSPTGSLTTKDKGESVRINKNAVFQPKQRFTPKIRWQSVLKPQKGPTALDLKAREDKELEEVRKTLRPGEILAKKVQLQYPQGFSVSGGIAYVDENGITQQAFMEYRMSGASLIEYLQEMQEQKKPVILYFEDFGGSKMLAGVRPAEPLTPQDRIPQREISYMIQYDPTAKNQNRIKVTGQSLELDIDHVRYFKDQDDFENTQLEMADKGLDIFGYPLSPQTKIQNFTKK